MRPPGRLINAGGLGLHVIRGGTGTPAVIFEAGAGQLAYAWKQVQEGVGQFTETLAWDRPGYGWSDVAPAPLELDSVCATLSLVLAEVPPPYVLVGHSLGAFYVRHFAALHPDQVAGVVLVDPSHERMGEGASAAMRAARRAAGWVQRHNPGLVRRAAGGRLRTIAAATYTELAGGDIDELVELHLRPSTLRLQFAEQSAVMAQATRLASAPGSLGDIPLVVLSADRLPGGDRFRRHRHDVQLPELVKLSTRGRLRIAAGSGHGIPLEQPEAVVAAVREVVGEARDR